MILSILVEALEKTRHTVRTVYSPPPAGRRAPDGLQRCHQLRAKQQEDIPGAKQQLEGLWPYLELVGAVFRLVSAYQYLWLRVNELTVPVLALLPGSDLSTTVVIGSGVCRSHTLLPPGSYCLSQDRKMFIVVVDWKLRPPPWDCIGFVLALEGQCWIGLFANFILIKWLPHIRYVIYSEQYLY